MAFYPKGFAYTRAFKMIDSADHFSKKTGLTCTVNISKAGAAFAAAAGAVSEIANGWYKVALSTVDAGTAGDLAFYITATGADDTDFVDQVFDASTANLGVNTVNIGGVTQTGRDLGLSVLLSSGTGTGQVDFTSGVVKANATQWLGGTIPAVNVTGVPLVDLKYTLGTISPAAAGSVRADAVTGAVGSVTGAVGSVAANGITAASIATNAIDADALAADAITEMRSMWSGTSDSGTTTTMVDAARIAVGFDNFFKGGMIWFTSGTNIGQARLITSSVGATGAITFDPAVALAVSTENYEILPACRVDLSLWLGAVVNALIAGNAPSNMQAGAAGVIDSTVAPNLNATVSSRATQAQILSDATPFAGANIAAIKAKTDFIVQGLQKNVAFANFQVFLVSSTDHVTGKTGAAPSGFRLRDAEAFFSALDNSMTERANGLYSVNLTANDLNADILTLGFIGTGADTRTVTIITKP